MRTAVVLALLTLSLSLASGCAAGLPSVAVKGSTPDRARLAGEWQGNFEALRSDLKGTIAFSLDAGRHTGSGAMTMTVPGEAQPRALALDYIQVAEGSVKGKVEAYKDPQCDCMVETEFEGALAGDLIEGTYTSRMVGTDKSRAGFWSVQRM